MSLKFLAWSLDNRQAIFVYILQSKMDKTEKNGKKIRQLKWPKYQKPKDEKMGWMKHKKTNNLKISNQETP